MQFGSTNAPAYFQEFIHNTITEGFDNIASYYLNDLLIYSSSEEEHLGHIQWIIQHLFEARLYMKLDNCEFHMETVQYRGFILSTTGNSMDDDMVETVRNWSCEKKTKNGRLNNFFDIHQFLRFCNYFLHFILKDLEKGEPFTKLTKRDEPFEWEAEQQLAFEMMIKAFTTAPVLCHFDHQREVIIAIDASDNVSAGVLSHYHHCGVLHAVGYISKKHTPAKCNYDIYNEELMPIIQALEEWRPECDGAAYALQ